MDELECMKVVDEALKSVADDFERVRVASWVAAKYGRAGEVWRSQSQENAGVGVGEASGNQIPGIAKLSPSGDLQLTVRDFKAKSANEAAVRLLHVTVWAAGKLLQEASVSSKSVIVPLLKKYRCYDGNTRSAIARDKGLVRDGDTITLDFHAEQFAEKVVAEILDPAVEGKWKPSSNKKRKARPSGFGHTETE